MVLPATRALYIQSNEIDTGAGNCAAQSHRRPERREGRLDGVERGRGTCAGSSALPRRLRPEFGITRGLPCHLRLKARVDCGSYRVRARRGKGEIREQREGGVRRPRVSVGSEGGDKDDRRRDKGVRSSVCGEEDLPTSEMRAMPEPGQPVAGRARDAEARRNFGHAERGDGEEEDDVTTWVSCHCVRRRGSASSSGAAPDP